MAASMNYTLISTLQLMYHLVVTGNSSNNGTISVSVDGPSLISLNSSLLSDHVGYPDLNVNYTIRNDTATWNQDEDKFAQEEVQPAVLDLEGEIEVLNNQTDDSDTSTYAPTDGPSPTPLASFPESSYVAYPNLGVAYKIHYDIANWSQVRDKCAEEGAELAVLDSREKIDAVKNQFGETRDVAYTAFHAKDDHTTWYDVNTGLPVSNLPWAAGEPSGSALCALFWPEVNGLGSFWCDPERMYLCQIPYSEDQFSQQIDY